MTKETTIGVAALEAAPKNETTAINKSKSLTVIEKQKTIEEHLSHFAGIEALVNQRRAYDTHLAQIEQLKISKKELTVFGDNNTKDICIKIQTSYSNVYTISNPKLVKEMVIHLKNLINNKVEEIDKQIFNYPATA